MIKNPVSHNLLQGKLLYCHPPPEVDPVGFNDFESREAVKHAHSLEQSCSEPDQNAPIPSKIDTEFFTKVGFQNKNTHKTFIV